ncbi:MAG: FkbM family methyltransferase [Firmicutes bacterium]|nr:FkbM family methyltransferase [Bacillota bacterium]
MRVYTSDVWDRMRECPVSLCLYGTGGGADKILDQMDQRSIPPTGILVSEDFYRGQQFRGFSVTTLKRLEETGQAFAVVVSFGSHLPELISRIQEIEKNHPVFIPDVPVAGDEIFDLAFYQHHLDELERARALLADDESRHVFDQIIEYKLTGDPAPLWESASSKEDVFKSLLRLSSDEAYIDAGAYQGDTLQEFLDHTESYRWMLAMEMDPYNFKRLKKKWESHPRTFLFHAACGLKNGTLYLEKSRGRGSHALSSPSSESAQAVPVLPLDCLELPSPPTYLKIDVEGQERETLLGASHLIGTYHPKLNIACYHRSRDLYELPLLLKELQGRYRMYLRRHPCFPCWDLNLYAVVE